MTKIILSFLVFSTFIAYGVVQGRSETQEQNIAEKVLAEANKGIYRLITGEELKREFLKSPSDLFLVDTRQEWEYQSQHIKGAVVLPTTPTWWYQYSPKARWEMKKVLGPDKDIKLIFY